MKVVSNTSPISNLAIILSLRKAIGDLRTEAHFFVSSELEIELLRAVGEGVES